MKTAAKIILTLVGVAAALIGGLFLTFWLAFTTTLQKLTSPDGKHEAKLERTDGIDRIYSIHLDGSRVFGSADFAPRRDFPFREALYFTDDGHSLVFEVGGHRIVGFDVATKRQLTDVQLLALPPTIPRKLTDYGYEAAWPGIGRAREVEAREATRQ